ncbi:MAG: hypothetical protein ACXQS3_01815 [Candidatus Methanofastidiosia archaeon]
MVEQSIVFDKIDEEVFPYILFLPTNREQLVAMLNGVFGSEVKITILKHIPACEDARIYQKDLVEALPYSNKTVLKNLKELCRYKVLHEGMEKQTGKKDVWVKYYTVDDKMAWLILLFKDPSELDNMQSIILQLARLYYTSLVDIAGKYGVSENDIKKEIGLTGS